MSDEQSNIQLSRRERQVLEMVVTGASNREIADKLVISINTVKVHMRNIFEKMGVQSRTEASMRALQEGLVSVPDQEAGSSDEADAGPAKSYLLEASAVRTIPAWRQIYLVAAAVVAVLFAALPLLPQSESVVGTASS